VLYYLVERAGQLVTKKELLDALWPDTVVSDVVTVVCVQELRRALLRHEVASCTAGRGKEAMIQS
jgi:DNA-binding winged helix-turn-helix (wHTH) protein